MKKNRIIVPVKAAVKRRIIIEAGASGVRAALTEDGEPVEFLTFAPGSESQTGNIFVGKVETVLKSGFAFVDIGLEKNAFLNLNDNKDAGASVKPGQPVAVQVTRDAYRDKGAYVTTKLAWPGRFFVVDAGGEPGVSISKKITESAERRRLTEITEELMKDTALAERCVIVRTDAAKATRSTLGAELTALGAEAAQAESVINSLLNDENAVLPAKAYATHKSHCARGAAELMASASYNVDEIIINDAEEHEGLSAVYGRFGVKVTLSEPGEGLFAKQGLEKSLEMTKRRNVPLPSGGYIVIERTEACVVIDVNSGQYAGKKGMEGMALKINVEAAREAAKQLRLRNLGGIIIIDFIGMENENNVRELQEELEMALAADKGQVVVEGMTRLGLMELTRKRTRNPLWN